MKTTMLAALGSAALVAAGCGGSSGLSKPDLAKKASAICAKYSQKGKALGSPDLNDPKQAEDYFVKATALARSQQNELEGLTPADAVKADYAKLTKATGDATNLLADLASAARARDRKKGIALVQKLQPISTAVANAANTIGAGACGGAA